MGREDTFGYAMGISDERKDELSACLGRFVDEERTLSGVLDRIRIAGASGHLTLNEQLYLAFEYGGVEVLRRALFDPTVAPTLRRLMI